MAGLGCSAAVTGPGIPFQGDPAELAAPPLILFLEPLINAYLTLVADVLQDLGMVTDSVVVEVGDEGAGEVRTIGTAINPRLIRRTEPHLALLAIRHKVALGKTAIAVEVVRGHLYTGGHELADFLQSLLVVIAAGTI